MLSGSRRHFGTVLIFSASLAATGPAAAGNESRYRAFALPDGQFEVIADFSENAIYWCGAGLFAQKQMSKSQSDRIFVLQGPAPSAALPGETAVRFGFELPSGIAPATGFTNDVSVVGNELSVSQAKQGCTERSASG